MFWGFEELDELSQQREKRERQKCSEFTDEEYEVFYWLSTAIYAATEKDTEGMTLKTNLHEVCERRMYRLLNVYQKAAYFARVTLDENDVKGLEAYLKFKTIGDLFRYLADKKHTQSNQN
ncbi:hypothetical protein U8V72_22145 [Priestia filamentosa]|uniref:hypothetical protein n=1 Tax=Priestia filamentosa TaxID=1402861 RepID=UPI0039788971